MRRMRWDRNTNVLSSSGAGTVTAVAIFDPSVFQVLQTDRTELWGGCRLCLTYRYASALSVVNSYPVLSLGICISGINEPTPNVLTPDPDVDWLDLWTVPFTFATTTDARFAQPSSYICCSYQERHIKVKRVLKDDDEVVLVQGGGFFNTAPADVTPTWLTNFEVSNLFREREL